MARDFESLIVDPDLLDPSIDATNLRTTTPTRQELLSDVPEFSGIEFDPTQKNYVSDLYALYSGQLPMTPVAPTPVAPTPAPNTGGGGSGGGGQATTTMTTPTSGGVGVNTPEQQRLIDEGIGLQISPGSPVFAPGEMPVTQAEIDAFNQIPVNTDFRNQQLVNQGIGVRVGDTGPVVAPGEAPVTQAEMDSFNQEQQGTLQNILGKAGQTVQGAMSELGKIPGAVVDAANKTVDIFGKKLNVGQTLAKAALNKFVGGPVSLLFDMLPNILPDDNIASSTNAARSTGLLQGDNTKTQDIYGINTQTSFDPVQSTKNYNDYNVKQVAKLENVLNDLKNNKYKGNNQLYLDNTKSLRKQLEDRKGYLDAINKDPLYGGDIQDTGDASIAEQIAEQNRTTGDLPDGGNIFDEVALTGGEETTAAAPTSTLDFDFEDQSYSGPGTGTVLGRPGIDRFDDAETDVDLSMPEGASKTGTPIDSLNPINRQQHFDNTEKLKDAVRAGKIDVPTYNVLSAFDATKTMGLGPLTGTAATVGYQGIQTLAGDQGVGDMLGDIGRNIQGVSGNLTPEQQVQYQEIITGKDIYRDSILGMVEPPAPKTLADPTISKMIDDIDLGDMGTIDSSPIETNVTSAQIDEFDTTPAAPPDGGFGDFEGPRGGPPTDDFDDFDDGTMTGTAATSMDDVLGSMPEGDGGGPSGSTSDGGFGNQEGPRGGGADMGSSSPSTGRGRTDAQSQYEDQSYSSPSSSGGGGGGGCFLADTLITMSDGSTKEVQKVDLGDNVAEGGKVFATGKFLVENLHDYKGIKVSGSHMVNEDDNWVRVEDSKHGKPLGDDEHIVYVFGSENRKILINGILFTDYFETTEQEKLINDEKDFFNNWKTYENKIDQDNINILNAS